MKGWLFVAFILLSIASSVPGQAGYNDLVSAWKAWAPPQYNKKPIAERKTDRLNETIPGEEKGTAASISGQSIWRSSVGDLKNLGYFLVPLKAQEKAPVWPVEKANAAIRSIIELDELESIAMVRNPAVLSASQTFKAELDGFDQVANLDAVLSRYAAFTTGIMTGGPMKSRPNISKFYPFPARSALKTKIIIENASLAALNLNITLRDTITKVRSTYWDLNLIHEKLNIFHETLGLFEHLHDIASTMYKTGKTSYQDVIQITIKKEIIEKEIATLVKKRHATGATLLSLLNLPRHIPLGRPAPGKQVFTIPKADTLIDQALENRQEILHLGHTITKMELMIEMAESMVLPSLDLGLSKNRLSHINTTGTWAKKDAFPGQGADAGMGAAMGASRPKKPWFGSAESWLSQTRKKLSALRHKKKDIQARTQALVQMAWFSLDDAVRTYLLYKNSIIGLSASALDVSTKEYEAGSVSFAQTAGAYNNWLNARLSFVKAKRDAAVFRANLKKTVGISF